MEIKKCVICDYDIEVHLHHIIKVRELGSHESSNTCFLCPSHHQLADFGSPEEQEVIMKLIFEKTGKKGSKINDDEIDLLDLKARVLQEEIYGKVVWEEQFWNDFKNTSNYESEICFLRRKGCPAKASIELNDKADKLIQIRKIKENMKGYIFA